MSLDYLATNSVIWQVSYPEVLLVRSESKGFSLEMFTKLKKKKNIEANELVSFCLFN